MAHVHQRLVLVAERVLSSLWVIDHVFTNLRNGVKQVSNLIYFARVNSRVLIVRDGELLLVEDASVMLSDLEDGLVVWLSVLILVYVN